MRLQRYIFLVLILVVLFSCENEEREVEIPLTSLTQSEDVELASPKVQLDSIFFHKEATIKALSAIEGGEIVFSESLFNFDQEAENFPSELKVQKTTELFFRAIHQDFQASTLTALNAYRLRDDIPNHIIELKTAVNPAYPGKGAEGLNDGLKGSVNFRSTNDWMGFQSDSIVVNYTFEDEVQIEALVLSLLKDQNSWIFEPGRVKVFSEGQEIFEQNYSSPKALEAAQFTFFALPMNNRQFTNLSIVIYPAVIPNWHAGGGSGSWLFIDEILFQ